MRASQGQFLDINRSQVSRKPVFICIQKAKSAGEIFCNCKCTSRSFFSIISFPYPWTAISACCSRLRVFSHDFAISKQKRRNHISQKNWSTNFLTLFIPTAAKSFKDRRQVNYLLITTATLSWGIRLVGQHYIMHYIFTHVKVHVCGGNEPMGAVRIWKGAGEWSLWHTDRYSLPSLLVEVAENLQGCKITLLSRMRGNF